MKKRTPYTPGEAVKARVRVATHYRHFTYLIVLVWTLVFGHVSGMFTLMMASTYAVFMFEDEIPSDIKWGLLVKDMLIAAAVLTVVNLLNTG